MVALLDTHCGLYMAQTSDNLARQHGITREEMDAYALRSQQRGGAPRAERGVFKEEIVPVDVAAGPEDAFAWSADDHPRPDTTLEGLAALKPAFGKDGFVTAGNASGIVDGAAALVVASRDEAERRGAQAARHASSPGPSRACRPRSWASGPCRRRGRRWRRPGCRSRDIDLVEVNEAFAGQYLAVEKELGLDRERTNVNGGAIALGHPLGATGTRLLLTLALELRRRRRPPRPRHRLHRRRSGHRHDRRREAEATGSRRLRAAASRKNRMEIKKVGVVGCGLMGSGIAQVCAEAGYQVMVREVSDELLRRAWARSTRSWPRASRRARSPPSARRRSWAASPGTTELEDLAGLRPA